MDGLAPDNIITDQDWGMAQSIENIFPTSVHRRCRWHIMKKAQEKLGGLVGRNPGLSKDFNDIVDFSFTPGEFETKWTGLKDKWPFIAGTHFDKLYEYRATWSTQRSEGFNAVLKRYVNPHNSVLNFVKQYEKIQTHVLVREGGNDYRTDHLEVELWYDFPIEKQAYEAYTRDIYLKFRTEFELIGKYNVCLHGASLFELYPNKEGWVANYGSISYYVTAEVEAGDYKCDCSKMSKDGMLCCHILKKFKHIGVDAIPAQYILRRWTQQAIPGAAPSIEAEPDEMPPQWKKLVRQANLSMDFASLARVASGCT
ncbi:protein FAR1-RELATED SEQUENCE 5-like [Aegilops tauschii subsp. strangulata]|uniref:protein FAR1-RELATED SEQUENCE 5-like n=1 Tax=Aegilops tauschii subsp. strangulata TaxID=200361 RepID=UPI003CC8CA3E